MKEYIQLVGEIKQEFPNFSIIYKDESQFMKFLDICLKVITLGKMTSFMTHFITTIGNTIYVPESWTSGAIDDTGKIIVLRHERVHLRQSQRYGRFLFSILYLLVLPTVFAFYRKKFEQEAYEESLRAIAELRGVNVLDDLDREIYIRHFTSAEYFWIWPFRRPIGRWFDETIEKIRRQYA